MALQIDMMHAQRLYATHFETPIGLMLGIADATALYSLTFAPLLEAKVMTALQKRGFEIAPGMTAPLDSIRAELTTYFSGKCAPFQTPYHLLGTAFQQRVWHVLSQIPVGTTLSYAEQARRLGAPSSYRAVANANGANPLAILIPCHRVIASDGSLGGYAGGVMNKQWLLAHELSTIQI